MDAPLGPKSPCLDGTADNVLIESIQAYLSYRLRRIAPSDELTHTFEDQFFPTQRNRIRRIASKCGVKGADLDDLEQNVWVAVVEKFPHLRHDGNRSVRAWFNTVVRTKTLDAIRRRIRHRAESLSDVQQRGGDPASRDLDPESAAEQRSARELAHEILDRLRDQLSPLAFLIFHLRWIDEIEIPEIARTLEMTDKKVRDYLYRAMRKCHGLASVYLPPDFAIEQ